MLCSLNVSQEVHLKIVSPNFTKLYLGIENWFQKCVHRDISCTSVVQRAEQFSPVAPSQGQKQKKSPRGCRYGFHPHLHVDTDSRRPLLADKESVTQTAYTLSLETTEKGICEMLFFRTVYIKQWRTVILDMQETWREPKDVTAYYPERFSRLQHRAGETGECGRPPEERGITESVGDTSHQNLHHWRREGRAVGRESCWDLQSTVLR